MELILKSELARRLGVSKSRVSRLIRNGLPTQPDGRLNAGEALEWVALHTDPVKRLAYSQTARPEVSSRGVGGQLLVARARKVEAEVRQLERRERLASGEVFEASAVCEFIREVHGLFRDALLSQADRLAGRLAAAGNDESRIHEILNTDNRAVLARLSKTIASGAYSKAEEGKDKHV